MGRVCGLGRGNPEVEVGETGALQSAKVPVCFLSSFLCPLFALVAFAAEMIPFFLKVMEEKNMIACSEYYFKHLIVTLI